MQALKKFYDKDGCGKLCYGSFLQAFRVPLTKRRYQMVVKVFSGLDKDKCGSVSVDDLKKGCNVTNACVKDGKVQLDDFLNYYTDLSVGITSDDFFCDMM